MGLLSKAITHVRNGQLRELEIREEMYHEQRTKRDYYRTAKCPRTRGGGTSKCASCTLAPMCKTGSRRW